LKLKLIVSQDIAAAQAKGRPLKRYIIGDVTVLAYSFAHAQSIVDYDMAVMVDPIPASKKT
jgi:hypothetical protein